MSLTIAVNDELARRLESQARIQRVPVEKWALMILSQAADRPQEFETWAQVNARRYELIQKRYSTGLNRAEEVEIAQLQEAVDKLLEPWDQQMLDRLKPYEALAERLAQQCHE